MAKLDVIKALPKPANLTDRRKNQDRRGSIKYRRIQPDRRHSPTDGKIDNSNDRRKRLDRRCGIKDRRIQPDRRYSINDLISNFRNRYIKSTKAKWE